MKINKILTISAIAVGALYSAPLTTGDILNQTKKPQLKEETKTLPNVVTKEYKAPLKASDSMTFYVKDFVFSGNSVFSSEELGQIVAKYKNQKMGVNKLKEIASLITKYYRDRSYFVAKAYIPEQTLKDGVVEITIIEGTYGGFDILNKSLVNDKEIQSFMDYLKNGQVVSTLSLERQMLIINELGGAIVTNAEVYPGQDVGTSNFKITVDKTEKYSGYAIVDNYGSKYTGEYRTMAGASINSITHIGDVLSVSGIVSNTANLKNFGLSYDRPLGYSGLKGGISASITNYTLDKIDNYEGSGTTKSAEMYLSYPIIKTRSNTNNIRLAINNKYMDDKAGSTNSVTEAKKQLTSLALSLDDKRNVNILDYTGKLYSTISLTSGKLKLSNDIAQTNDADLDTNGKYAKLNLDVTYLQRISTNVSLQAVLKAQQSLGKNLDSSEDLSTGGSNGLRAYEDSELSGDKGYLFSCDLMYTLPNYSIIKSNSVSIFLDNATIWKNDATFNTDDNKRVLSDVGIGYNAGFEMFDLKTSFAHGFGNESAPTSETEFSKGQNKFLAQAMYRF